MHSVKRVVARGDTGDRRAFHDSSPTRAAVVQAEKASAIKYEDLRVDCRGGRRLSDQVGATDELVPCGLLRELAEAQIRRECRKKHNFDWDAFLAAGRELPITQIVYPRAVREGLNLGMYPWRQVLQVVRDVIAQWTDQPWLRPTYQGFCEEQGRRGEQGRETQAEKARRNMDRVLAVVAEGETSDTLIADRLDLDRSTVYRIRRKAAAEAVSVVLQETTDVPEPPVFPDLEIPPAERWPVMQFIRRTGAVLGAGDARYLADVGRCYEAEGRVDQLVDAIGRSAGAEVRDPWAYLQRCMVNRGDAWTVTPQLLADVLTWAGEKKLEYSLLAIGSGQVQRPLPYLRRVVATAVGEGKGKVSFADRPVAMAVAMSARLAPALQVEGVEDAVAAEAQQELTGHVESYRRRHGRLPWEGSEDVPNCCIGLKRSGDEEFNLVSKNLDSSEESRKADATAVFERREVPPDRGFEKLERAENGVGSGESGRDRCAGSHGEAGNQGQGGVSTLPRGNPLGSLEQGPCRHPLASLLTAGMVLNDVVPVDCAAGCGHWIYSDRGALECLCCRPTVRVSQVARALQAA